MSYALDVRAPAELEQGKAATTPSDAAVVPWSESAATVPDNAPIADGSVFDEDKELLDRLATGDDVAFRLLVERHIDRAYAIALRIIGNAADAEDVVQDTMLKVWTHRGQWQHGLQHRAVAKVRVPIVGPAQRHPILGHLGRLLFELASLWRQNAREASLPCLRRVRRDAGRCRCYMLSESAAPTTHSEAP